MVISLYKKRGGRAEIHSESILQRSAAFLRCFCFLCFLASLSLLLAFGCSSCTARELAALLPHPQQIKKACTAQRTVTNRFAVHRRRHMILFRRLRQPMLQLRPRAARL